MLRGNRKFFSFLASLVALVILGVAAGQDVSMAIPAALAAFCGGNAVEHWTAK